MKWSILKLGMGEQNEVRAGDVGYIITGIKNAKEVRMEVILIHHHG